jgi:hypothetical protein
MTQVKERPILFSAPMVRAILDGRKTVTRRPVKGFGLKWLEDFAPQYVADPANSLCPFGNPGDRLYVRETWSDVNLQGAPGIAYRADDDIRDLMEDESFLDDRGAFNYDDPRSKPYQFACWSEDLIAGTEGRWRPSIHMPRWACRILLEITDVRVERLQDISEGQAVDEGLVWEGVKDGQTYWNHADHRYPPGSHQQFSVSGTDAISAFRNLWKSTDGDWDANPWVWVVEFKRVTP